MDARWLGGGLTAVVALAVGLLAVIQLGSSHAPASAVNPAAGAAATAAAAAPVVTLAPVAPAAPAGSPYSSVVAADGAGLIPVVYKTKADCGASGTSLAACRGDVVGEQQYALKFLADLGQSTVPAAQAANDGSLRAGLAGIRDGDTTMLQGLDAGSSSVATSGLAQRNTGLSRAAEAMQAIGG